MKTHTRTLTSLALATALLAIPSVADAQLSLEGRVGSSIPVGDLADDAVFAQTAGLSFAAEGMLSLSERATAYAGVSRHDFNCDGCSVDVSTMGFNTGIKLLLGSGNALPWVRGGLMIHRPEVGDVDGDWEVGVDTGVGVDWRVNRSFSIVPAARLNSYSSGDASITFATLDLGLHFHTGG